ncbi:MAG: B12-binding domain-containing protein, partial [Deltaproteobacteria bacterium]|nr:B12-binding domain-containing protein [Deltaproteobacteria bacterium]
MHDLTKLGQALVDLKEEKVIELVKKKLEVGEDPLEIIKECNAGMVEIGKRFETNEIFISELIMSGAILKSA